MKGRIESALRLQQHLSKLGCKTERVSPAVSKNEGLGLFANEKLRAGSSVLQINANAWRPLSANTAWERLNKETPKLCEDLVDFASSRNVSKRAQVMLVGSVSFLVHLLLELESDVCEFEDHLESIPKSIQVPLFWDSSKLSELQGSPLVDHLLDQRNLIHSVYLGIIGPHLGHKISPPNFSFAWALTLSRAISSSSDSMPFCIIPFFDLLNHQSVNSHPGFCEHYYDEGSATFHVVPKQDIQEGQELFISYGNIGNSDLLRKYGFCAEENPFDSVSFQHPTLPNLTIACSKDGDITINPNDESSSPSTPIDKSGILPALENRLKQYSSSLDEDRILLEKLSTINEASDFDLQNALLVRIGEKEALSRGITNLRG